MSLKQLHACITDLFIEWHKEHPNDPYLHRLHSKIQIILADYTCIPNKIMEEGKFLERAKILLSDHIIIPRKQLEELMKTQPRSPWDFIKVRKWFEKLDKMLEESK